MHVARKARGRYNSLLGVLPMGSNTRGTFTYAYSNRGMKRFDTFNAELFESGPWQNAGLSWANWLDLRAAYEGVDRMRKIDVVQGADLLPTFMSRDPDYEKPALNLGAIRPVIALADDADKPVGGPTEHVVITQKGVPVRFTLSNEARNEFLCQLQSTSQLPTFPTCEAPMVAVVRETVMNPDWIDKGENTNWADEVRLAHTMLDSARHEDTQLDPMLGFRLPLPNGTQSYTRWRRNWPDSPDMRQVAYENRAIHMGRLPDTAVEASDPREQPLRLPPWLRLGHERNYFHPDPVGGAGETHQPFPGYRATDAGTPNLITEIDSEARTTSVFQIRTKPDSQPIHAPKESLTSLRKPP